MLSSVNIVVERPALSTGGSYELSGLRMPYCEINYLGSRIETRYTLLRLETYTSKHE